MCQKFFFEGWLIFHCMYIPHFLQSMGDWIVSIFYLLQIMQLWTQEYKYLLEILLSIQNLPAMQETQEMQFWSLDQEDPLEEKMATCSLILAWKTPWTEEPGKLQSTGSQRVRHDWVTSTHSPCPAYSHRPCQYGSDTLIIVWASCYWSARRHVLTCVWALFSGYMHHEHHRS